MYEDDFGTRLVASLVLLILVLIGVSLTLTHRTQASGVQERNETIKIDDNVDANIYIIDSCEYIGRIGYHSDTDWATHKGNCKFCAQRNKK